MYKINAVCPQYCQATDLLEEIRRCSQRCISCRCFLCGHHAVEKIRKMLIKVTYVHLIYNSCLVVLHLLSFNIFTIFWKVTEQEQSILNIFHNADLYPLWHVLICRVVLLLSSIVVRSLFFRPACVNNRKKETLKLCIL